MKYNLQFFAKSDPKPDPEPDPTPEPTPDPTDDVDVNIDPNAFAEIISEKDKTIDNLTNQISELQKTNAKLLLKISAGSHDTEKTTEEKIYGFMNPGRS